MANTVDSLKTDTTDQLHGCGSDMKTVITCTKQLEMSRDDYKGKWMLVGNAIEDSGLDDGLE